MDTVAVLLSTYNGEKYIREQIESIRKQEGDYDISIFVRDDGSTDGTIKLLYQYASEGVLHFIEGENLGPAGSFLNLLYNCGTFDYYAFSDQDDVWFPFKIDKAVQAHKEVGSIKPVLYCSNAQAVDEDLNSLGRNVNRVAPKTDFKTICCSGGLLGCTMVMNRTLVELVRINRLQKRVVLHDFFIGVLCTSVGGLIIYDEKASMGYRQHVDNVVGIPIGLKNTIKNRFKSVLTKPRISIGDQAQTILDQYGDYILETNKDWLKKIANYRSSIIKRIMLSVSRETHYVSLNMGLKIRLSILLGNR